MNEIDLIYDKVEDNCESSINDPESSSQNYSLINIDYSQSDKNKMLHIEASLPINPFMYNYAANLIRFFFLDGNYIESYEQNKLCNLNSCINIYDACLYDMFKFCYALPQSNELWVDYQILMYSSQKGFFTYSTIYKNDFNGLNNYIEQVIEFSLKGGMYDLEKLIRNLLDLFGFKNTFTFKSVDYNELIQDLQITDFTYKNFSMLNDDPYTIYFIKGFNKNAYVKWNDYFDVKNNCYNKLLLICRGKELICGSQKSESVDEMRENFMKTKDFSKKCEFFLEERVIGELNSYLELQFFKRCTGTICFKNLIHLLEQENLIKDIKKI